MLGVVLGLVKAVIAFIAIYGLTMTDQQTGAVIALTPLIVSLFQRTQTAPIVNGEVIPRDPIEVVATVARRAGAAAYPRPLPPEEASDGQPDPAAGLLQAGQGRRLRRQGRRDRRGDRAWPRRSPSRPASSTPTSTRSATSPWPTRCGARATAAGRSAASSAERGKSTYRDALWLPNPEHNALAAFSIFKAAGYKFTPWSTFTSGAYLGYMQRAIYNDGAEDPAGLLPGHRRGHPVQDRANHEVPVAAHRGGQPDPRVGVHDLPRTGDPPAGLALHRQVWRQPVPDRQGPTPRSPSSGSPSTTRPPCPTPTSCPSARS